VASVTNMTPSASCASVTGLGSSLYVVSMRRYGLVLLCTLGLATFVAATARAHSTPQIRAEKSRERTVMAQVNQIGTQLQRVEDRAWNAQQRVAQVNQSLRRNEFRLHVARGNLKAAQKRLMARMYSLYVNGAPSTIDVIAGAHSISQLISRAESAQVLSNQDAALGKQALSFEQAVQHRERQLQHLKRTREAALHELLADKQRKASELAHEKQLLASIHTTLQQLVSQEQARERAARAAALARLQAQLAEQAREKKAAAAAAAQQTSQSTPSTPTSIVPPPGPPVASNGAGHPQAASIALQYLGVPYVYGGASPTGFDCSGLVMYVYARLGISLPHYTVAQWNATQPVASPAPGDLVFFDGLGHVGIYIGNGQMVDAPHTGSVVRIDSISGFGSYNGARRVP
jgi:peptidoglycan DL-endopeptidase CwlO